MRFLTTLNLLCLAALLCSTGCATVEGNTFNPYVQSRLPSAELSNDGAAMAKAIGGRATSLQDEASYRPHWKEEVYPVVFGNRKSANEILVFLDYSSPESERLWREVVAATRSLDPKTSKVVVLGKSTEQYGTELMGGGIWTSYSRPKQALDYFSFSLNRWNAVKAQLARQGQKRPFVYEYDATAQPTDQPILYSFLYKVRPAVAEKEHVGIVRYAFDAGNVNMYQAVQASRSYGVKKFPAVVVNDTVLSQPTAKSIVQAATRD